MWLKILHNLGLTNLSDNQVTEYENITDQIAKHENITDVLITWPHKNKKWMFSSIGISVLTLSVTAVSSATITLIGQDLYKQSQYPIVTKERLNHLIGDWSGDWKGEFTQEFNKGLIVTTGITVTLINKGRIINGHAQVNPFKGKPTELRLFNGIFDGTILKIEYESKESYIFQKGSVITKITPNGDKFNGKFLGYSPSYDDIISGEITISKVKK